MYTAIFAAGSLLGPILGPVAGGYLTLSVNWRWSFWLVVIAVCVYANARKRHSKADKEDAGRSDYRRSICVPKRDPRYHGTKV